MKKVILAVLAMAIGFMFVSSQAFAITKDYRQKGEEFTLGGKDATPYKDPAQRDAAGYEKGDFHKKVTASDFPEKGWHKGPYLTANIGMMQVTNDKNVVSDKKFNGPFDVSFGLSFGWDIADWIGPLLQINYATASSSVGTGAAVTKDGINYPATTFPVENAREHAADISLFVKATAPYFVYADWQPKSVKIIPYAKLGGTAHGVYVNAPTSANKAGALGGGPAIGLGCEFFIWNGFYVGIDATEHLIIQKAFYKNLTDDAGTTRNTKITESGFKPQFTLYGMIGWHF